jgi:DNA-binding CsgD family transcriptional regulator
MTLNVYSGLYLFALAASAIGISISAFLSFRYRIPIQIYFTLFLAAMVVELLYFFARLACPTDLFADGSTAGVCLKLAYAAGFALFLYSFPSWILLGFRGGARRAEKAVCASLALALPALCVAHLLLRLPYLIVYVCANAFFLGTVAYCVTVVFLNRGRFADRKLRRIVLLSVLIALAGAPLIVYDVVIEKASFSLPIFSFAFNLLGLLFSFAYASVPPFLEQNRVSDFFARRYRITGREREILSLLKLGFSNGEIGRRMFISLHTVENHVYNIYRKLKVKNRGGALNRLEAFREDDERAGKKNIPL